MLVGVLLKAVGGICAEHVMELPRISAVSNSAPGDAGALVPRGPQMGAPTLAGRGQAERDWVCNFVVQCAPSHCICPTEQGACGSRRHCWRLPTCRLGVSRCPKPWLHAQGCSS